MKTCTIIWSYMLFSRLSLFYTPLIYLTISGMGIFSVDVWAQSNLLKVKESPVKSKESIVVGLIVFPPLVQQDFEGRCFGSTVERIYEIFLDSPFSVDLYCATPARVYRDLSNGKLDLTVNVKSTESLVDMVYFSKSPVNMLEVILYSNKNSGISSVSAIRQFSYHGIRDKLLLEGYSIYDQPNSKEAITLFLRGGTNALISYRLPFEFYLNELLKSGAYTRDGSTLEVKSLLKVPTYFVVNKTSQHSQSLLAILNNID